MSAQRTITETVEIDTRDLRGGPVPIAEFVTFVQAIIANIPAEAQASATIELTTDRDYDFPQPVLEVKYKRAETDEERNQRTAKEKADAESKFAAIERAERETLSRLKAKYEPVIDTSRLCAIGSVQLPGDIKP